MLLLIVLGCGVVVAATGMLMRPKDKGPVYHGTPVNAWLEERCQQRRSVYFDPEAQRTLRLMGTNALPWLLNQVGYESGAWRTELVAGYDKLPRWMRSQKARRWLSAQDAEGRADWARDGFYLLGADASPAVPVLLAWSKSPRSSARRARAKLCLGFVIMPAEVMAQRLASGDELVAATAARGLAQWWRTKPEVAVPALGRCLRQSPFESVRRAAADALGEFGEDARPAAPAIVYAMTDISVVVREVATNALRRIEPKGVQGPADGEWEAMGNEFHF
jgi:hypothetical protein